MGFVGILRSWLTLLLVLAALVPQPASAQFNTVARIDAGRESEILALLGPYRGEAEIVGGWRVTSVRVVSTFIRFELTGPQNERAALLLRHPGESGVSRTETSASFAFEREDPGSARTALDLLSATVRARDPGGFWPSALFTSPSKQPTQDIEKTPTDELRERARSSAWREEPPQHFGSLGNVVVSMFTDGLVIVLIAMVLVFAHLRRVLRQVPRWVPWALLGLVVVGAALRYALSPETVMNAWPYTRTPPLVKAILGGVVMQTLSARMGWVIHLTDAIHLIDFLIAVVTPVAFFAHARFALDGWKPALFASALLVFLPIHLHFARSDVEYVQSLATSSLTFVALYTSLRDPSRAWRWFALALLPVLSLATYAVRPENMVFVVIDVGAILLTAGRDVPRGRRITVLAVVVGVALYSLLTRLLVGYGQNVSEGLSLETLVTAARLVFDVERNTLINVSITPIVVAVLAVAGLVHLVRSGQQRRALYLSGWMVSFFVVHSYVVPREPLMMARYHMHLITPLLLMAAAALPLLLSAPRLVTVAVGLAVVLAPATHHAFITRADFVIMREYDLIRASRELIPDGCTVLEFLPADSLTDRRLWSPGDSRMLRHGAVLRDGRPDERWTVVNLAVLEEPGDGQDPRHEVLTEEARALLADPPECLVFLEGMTCHTHRPPDTARAPACDEPLSLTRAQTLAQATFPIHVYDERNMGRLENLHERVADGTPMSIALYRLWPRQAPAPNPSATAGDAP